MHTKRQTCLVVDSVRCNESRCFADLLWSMCVLVFSLRVRSLRLPVEVTVMGWDADFGEWAQLDNLSEIQRQPGFKVKLSAKK